MSYSFELRQEALKEFADAFIWYEEKREGLGKLFKTAIERKLKLICNNPFHYKTSYKEFREALVDKFPFLIVYNVDHDARHIIIIAIFHTSRNPRKKIRT